MCANVINEEVLYFVTSKVTKWLSVKSEFLEIFLIVKCKKNMYKMYETERHLTETS